MKDQFGRNLNHGVSEKRKFFLKGIGEGERRKKEN